MTSQSIPSIPKLFVQTFGCQMNIADSDEITRVFRQAGYCRSGRLEDADAVLVNTCTVRQHDEDRAASFIGRLTQWKSARAERFIVVATSRLKTTLARCALI